MLIDSNIIRDLFAKAADNTRKRINFDLRTTPDDNSQRMLNALLPGTSIPIHRHPTTAETVIVLQGSLTEIFYDSNGTETARYNLNPTEGRYGIQIPPNVWHKVIVHEPTIIIEAKDGPYQPLSPDDTLAE